MNQRYVLLRSARRLVSDVFAAPSATALEMPMPVSTETHELSRREVLDLAADRSVLALAPSMPMSLTQPVKVAPTSSADLDRPAWGVQAVGADQSPFDGSDIVVAVLDTGIDPEHVAFHGVQLERRNFTSEPDDDLHGHGTHCAGTIFGRDVDGVRIGVAPGVRRALIGKVLGAGGGTSDQIARAVTWAVESGANVVSMSLGIDFTAYAQSLEHQEGLPEAAAISRALEGYRQNVLLFERLASYLKSLNRPVVIVAAAGNSSDRDGIRPYEVAVAPPAVADGFISVAAVGKRQGGLTVAGFSNTGANVAAPGVDVVSANRGGGLITMSGTSMATPHVAGVAALWAQQLRKANVLNKLNLEARLVGSGSLQGFVPGVDVSDTGVGMVRAPR